MIFIRQETPKDYHNVFLLIQEAFKEAAHTDGNEHNLAKALRKSNAFIPALSLVAEIDGELAGHILFTKGIVGTETILILAPLSVAPKYQKQGVGGALICHGHEIAKKLGYSYSLVLGSEAYYPRFGYRPGIQLGMEIPPCIPPENFMILPLTKVATPLKGTLIYPKEFGI